jgi:LAS superfamily LD-carboxypeptidase LdcB
MLKNFFIGFFGVSILIISLIFLEVNASTDIKPSNFFISKQENIIINSQENSNQLEAEIEGNIYNYQQNLEPLVTNIDQIYQIVYKKKQGMPPMLPNEYKDYYDNYKYKNVENIQTEPPIFNNQEADKRIRKIAEERGYKLRNQAVESELVSVSGQRLQTQGRDSWLELQSNAKKDDLNLVLVSGYRSVSDQRNLFMTDLNATGFNNQNIKDGLADKAIDEILQTRSIPGYSRHHTGFTFDIGCNSNNLLNFKTTACYDWISKDNYYQAKKVGLIPSYPNGGGLQGPNPEEWEYVWVGVENLK